MKTSADGRQSGSSRCVFRRELLAATAGGAATALAGCASGLGGSDPRSLSPPAVFEDGPMSQVWAFPRGAPDEQRPIQAYLKQESRSPNDAQFADVRFAFGATVFGHTPYHHDRIALRLRAPARPEAGRTPADILVHPLAGGFTSFRTHVNDRETVIALDELETEGTIQFAFLIDPQTRPTPETLGYEFEITAEHSGLLGRDVVASASGRFAVAPGDS